jgi:hypothetical protein
VHDGIALLDAIAVAAECCRDELVVREDAFSLGQPCHYSMFVRGDVSRPFDVRQQSSRYVAETLVLGQKSLDLARIQRITTYTF